MSMILMDFQFCWTIWKLPLVSEPEKPDYVNTDDMIEEKISKIEASGQEVQKIVHMTNEIKLQIARNDEYLKVLLSG